MKRIMLISVVVVMLGLFLSLTAQAGPEVNEDVFFCTDLYISEECDPELSFSTKFWKEKFFGGGPGEEGNVIMAIGEGFVLQNLVLKVGPVPYVDDDGNPAVPPPPHCPSGTAVAYMTQYGDGMLTLNSTGPWLDKGSLKSKNVILVNVSCHDGAGNFMGFSLIAAGQFEKSDYEFGFVAFFEVLPDNYIVKTDTDGVVYHEGYDFDAGIQIFQ